MYFPWKVYYHLLCVFDKIIPHSDEPTFYKFVVDFDGSHGGALVAEMAAGVFFFGFCLHNCNICSLW